MDWKAKEWKFLKWETWMHFDWFLRPLTVPFWKKFKVQKTSQTFHFYRIAPNAKLQSWIRKRKDAKNFAKIAREAILAKSKTLWMTFFYKSFFNDQIKIVFIEICLNMFSNCFDCTGSERTELHSKNENSANVGKFAIALLLLANGKLEKDLLCRLLLDLCFAGTLVINICSEVDMESKSEKFLEKSKRQMLIFNRIFKVLKTSEVNVCYCFELYVLRKRWLRKQSSRNLRKVAKFGEIRPFKILKERNKSLAV